MVIGQHMVDNHNFFHWYVEKLAEHWENNPGGPELNGSSYANEINALKAEASHLTKEVQLLTELNELLKEKLASCQQEINTFKSELAES